MTRQQSFSFNSATVTVRESLGIDRVDRQLVYQRLVYNRADERDVNRAVNFADFVTRSTVSGELDFPWASLDSDAADMQAAYDAWLQWPTGLMDRWMVALHEVGDAPGNSATQPDTDPNA